MDVAGVVLNRVASDGHALMLREALAGLRRARRRRAASRRPAACGGTATSGWCPSPKRPSVVAATLDALGAAITAGCDLDVVMRIARAAPTLTVGAVALPAPGPPVRVAVATGRAFTFLYADTVDALVAAGAEVVPFDPLVDRGLPDAIAGLLVGGGFPEVHAVELADNVELLGDVAARVRDGLVTWAECGGLLWLARSLDGVPMAGVLPVSASMGERLTLGYRDVRTLGREPARSLRARRSAVTSSTTRRSTSRATRSSSSPASDPPGPGSPRRRCSRRTCTITPAATRAGSRRSWTPAADGQ